MSMKKNYVVETLRKAQMVQLLSQGKRIDGRGLDQLRELKIETGVIPKANGSAKVTLGNTQVIAGVKIAQGYRSRTPPTRGY